MLSRKWGMAVPVGQRPERGYGEASRARVAPRLTKNAGVVRERPVVRPVVVNNRMFRFRLPTRNMRPPLRW